jgi:hypothetical protein
MRVDRKHQYRNVRRYLSGFEKGGSEWLRKIRQKVLCAAKFSALTDNGFMMCCVLA